MAGGFYSRGADDIALLHSICCIQKSIIYSSPGSIFKLAGLMGGWIERWMGGCMDGWVRGWMDVWVDGCMDEWMDMVMDDDQGISGAHPKK